MIKTITLFAVLFFTGCCSIMNDRVLGFSVENLPVAIVGEYYDFKFMTTGYPVIRLRTESPTEYENNGIKVNAFVDEKMRGVIQVSGIPQKSEMIYFEIEGSTPGTQCPGLQFRKKFSLLTIDSSSKLEEINNIKSEPVVTVCLR